METLVDHSEKDPADHDNPLINVSPGRSVIDPFQQDGEQISSVLNVYYSSVKQLLGMNIQQNISS